jgi:drug/metabolite transporter (DMT)-like permease
MTGCVDSTGRRCSGPTANVGYISAVKIGLPKATKLNASTENESMDKGSINYRLGTSYAVATAILVSFQEPFSALAARSLRSLDFMAFTQLALVFSIPLLILRADSRRDFTAIVFNLKNWPKLGVIFLVGTAGLILYNVGLSSTHPIITAAVLNLSPFWAAFIAFVVSKRSISSPRWGASRLAETSGCGN